MSLENFDSTGASAAFSSNSSCSGASSDVCSVEEISSLDTTSEKRGLVVGHGRNHRPIDSLYLDLTTNWVYLDRNTRYAPDYILDFLDKEAVFGTFQPGSFDYVLLYHCPIGGSARTLDKFFYMAFLLLKKGGVLINHPGMGFYLGEMERALRSCEIKNGKKALSEEQILQEMEMIRDEPFIRSMIERAQNNAKLSEEEKISHINLRLRKEAVENLLQIRKKQILNTKKMLKKLNGKDSTFLYLLEQYFANHIKMHETFGRSVKFSDWYIVGGLEKITRATGVAFVK